MYLAFSTVITTARALIVCAFKCAIIKRLLIGSSNNHTRNHVVVVAMCATWDRDVRLLF